MKYLILPLCLFGAIHAYGQDQSTPTTPVIVLATINQTATPAYKSINDTIKPSFYFSKSNEVEVLSTPTPRWSVIRRGKAEYYILSQHLTPTTSPTLQPITIPVDPVSGTITYSEVVQVPGASQAELYIRAKEWFVINFRNPASVIQVDEKQDGVLIGKAWQDNSSFAMLSWVTDSRLWYTVKITVKDGRYKYELSNFMEQTVPTRLDIRPSDPYPIESYALASKKPNGKPRYSVLYFQQHLDAAAHALANSVKVSMAGKQGGDW